MRSPRPHLRWLGAVGLWCCCNVAVGYGSTPRLAYDDWLRKRPRWRC